jgi:uncharacterized protein
MFRVNLVDLDREGTLAVRREIPWDDPLWEDTDLALRGTVMVELAVSATPTGQVVARGALRASLDRKCRRCLEPVDPVIDERLELVWAVADELGDEEDEQIRVLAPTGNQLDMGPAIREELVLTAPPWVLCREDCCGLCPHCGVNLNVEECSCSPDERDPRWDALRALKNDTP